METGEELRFDRGDDTPEQLKRQLARLAGMTAAQMSRVSRDALRTVGAHKDHFVVLAALAEYGPVSQAALSDRTRVYKSDLVSVLNELEQGDWVRRTPDPADKRRNVITVTGLGERHLAELDRILDDVNEHIMSPLDHDERVQLFMLLNRINIHLATAGNGPVAQAKPSGAERLPTTPPETTSGSADRATSTETSGAADR